MFETLPVRDRIGVDQWWRVGHAFNSSLPGWLILVPRRHVATIAELTRQEAAGLGVWQVRLSQALHAVTGSTKTYVAQFAEAAGHRHVHFHVIPRMRDLPPDLRGPNVFQLLGQAGAAVPGWQMDEVATRLRDFLTSDQEGEA